MKVKEGEGNVCSFILHAVFNVNMFLKLMFVLFDRAKRASYFLKVHVFFYIRN